MKQKNLIIIGAGEAGKLVARDIIHNSKLTGLYSIVGFLDDRKTGEIIEGLSVIGTIDDALELIKKNDIDEVIIAIPSATYITINDIVRKIGKSGVLVKIVPGIYEIVKGTVRFSQIREIDPVDLLGREEVDFNITELSASFYDKTVFVTGAGGSIGSEIIRQLRLLPVKKIIAFGRGENSIHSLIHENSSDNRLEYIIGDIRDKKKILWELSRTRPDILFHAAAHKHVPFMEDFPDEAIKNNIGGTFNCAMAACETGVTRFILISTDKSVNPGSVMGATKRIAENLILSLNGGCQTMFSLVRFGNVLGSRGSVIPVFNKQIEQGGPVTITDPAMTRFFMSIREAARLVIKSVSVDRGNIFILDMGQPIKIVELAKSLISMHGFRDEEIKIVYSGVRKGEKLYEELSTENEKPLQTGVEKLLVLNQTCDLSIYKNSDALVSKLMACADTYDKSAIKKMLSELLPDYCYND